MSTFSCPVVRVAEVINHPNADRLSIVKLEGLGYLCIANKLEDGSPRYQPGDFVVYIPSASVLPEWLLKYMGFWNDETGRGMLAGSGGDRVKPLKLRGIFSEGVIFPTLPMSIPDACMLEVTISHNGNDGMPMLRVGEDASEVLGITKWSPPIPVAMAGEVASVAEAALTYDFQRWESVPDIFEPGEVVVATEKLHGTCCIIQYFPDMDHPEMFSDHGGYCSITVSSKGLGGQGLVFKNNEANANNLYVRALGTLLADHDLAGLLHSMSKVDGGAHPVAILGEVFGKGVQDLDYGTTKPTFRVFDMRIGREWLSPDAVAYWAKDLPCVPTLYTGPFDQTAIEAVRDGVTTVGGTNVREGVVVRSLVPTEHPLHGRKICKFISPAYLLRRVKNGEATEFN
jgi:RNA ligase (TIGR02306 family)